MERAGERMGEGRERSGKSQVSEDINDCVGSVASRHWQALLILFERKDRKQLLVRAGTANLSHFTDKETEAQRAGSASFKG
jgi:hypothetical protein